jgi:predicted PurR-regulated permease PerM
MMERPVALFCLLLLAVGCYLVLRPFLSALLWGIILAISTWPLHVRLTHLLGGRTGLSATILTLAAVSVLVIPLIFLVLNLSDNVQELAATIRQWRIDGLPPPPPWVETVPIVGVRLHRFWVDAADSGATAAAALAPYLQTGGRRILGFGASLGGGIVHICISLIIAFVFYRNGRQVAAVLDSVLERLAGREGARLEAVAAGTLKGVVYGIIGTNLVEAVLAAIGFQIAGVPGPLLLGLFCFFLTLIPAGPTVIWLPAVLWLFAIGETGWAIFLIAWNIVVFGVIEALLRTVLVSRGSELPMVLILLGLFGGLLTFGFLGLFLGPCLLALGYTLIGEWSGAEQARRRQDLPPIPGMGLEQAPNPAPPGR